jgi:tetratricopeptide (TPR) repeat protein
MDRQTIDEARELLRTARYDAVFARLEGCEGWPSPLCEQGIILRAEALVRRDPTLALELLARLNDLFRTPEGRYEYYLTSGRAHAASRDFATAASMFDIAAGIDAEHELRRAAELAHQRARLLWFTGHFEPDHRDVTLALQNTDPGARMATLVVRGWMRAELGDYGAQIADFRAAIALARKHPERMEAHTLARAVHSLLRIGSELGDAEAVADGEALFETFDWTPDLGSQQFLCLRALAWHAFLSGDSARAQWLLRDSKNVAPNDAWRVMAHADRAYVARMNRNELWAREEVSYARALAEGVSWASTHDEERQVLVTLAVLYAPIDMGQAQRFVSTYMRIGVQSVDPTLALGRDKRAEAFAQYASGSLQQVLGNTTAAEKAFQNAYDVFSEAQHHFRAALAAHGLAEVTQASIWEERARRHAAHFPKSAFYEFLAERISRPAAPWIDGLTPMRRQLALAVCEGLDMTTLSQRFSRSEFTIKREIHALFDTFGVNSRDALRRMLEQRGAL